MADDFKDIIPPTLWRLDKEPEVLDIIAIASSTGELEGQPGAVLKQWLNFLGQPITVDHIQRLNRRLSDANNPNQTDSPGSLQEGAPPAEPSD